LVDAVVVKTHFGTQAPTSRLDKNGYFHLRWPRDAEARLSLNFYFAYDLENNVHYHLALLIFTQQGGHVFDVVNHWRPAAVLVISHDDFRELLRPLFVQSDMNVLHDVGFESARVFPNFPENINRLVHHINQLLFAAVIALSKIHVLQLFHFFFMFIIFLNA
jgi:hypothetical protein